MARLSGQSRVSARKDATASYIGAGVATPIEGVGVIRTLSVLRDLFRMRDNLRMTDNG
ncbi:hypothetical protein [Devosia submarina]|uniref:hypothetical protein n=1 Tax=Devosia submarina TaxID=1173082 RepID=UPI00130049BC|nr:hypothetical protein [Devosia submarina]